MIPKCLVRERGKLFLMALEWVKVDSEGSSCAVTQATRESRYGEFRASVRSPHGPPYGEFILHRIKSSINNQRDREKVFLPIFLLFLFFSFSERILFFVPSCFLQALTGFREHCVAQLLWENGAASGKY